MTTPIVRIAAIADLHIRTRDDLSYLRDAFSDLQNVADILLIAGDLTEMGRLAEMELLAEVLAEVDVPIFVTFGNHDRRGMRRSALKKVLRSVGAIVLEGTGAIATLPSGHTLGIAGVTGTGGGFGGKNEEVGPGGRFARALMVKSRRESARLRRALRELRDQNPDSMVVMTHFSPTASTLQGEPPLKYWMLGNAQLGTTIDDFDVDLVVHGHAHLGQEFGKTVGSVPVLNVALPVIGGMRILDLDASGKIVESQLRPIESLPTATEVRERDIR